MQTKIKKRSMRTLVCIIIILITVPTIGCTYFAVQYRNLDSYVSERLEEIAQAEAEREEYREQNYYEDYYEEEEELLKGAVVPIPYQLMHPHLFIENDFIYIDAPARTVYLTFDDGPTALTARILNILRDRGVPATFFVIYQRGEFAEEMYRRIVDEGHALAHHSASHNYRQIYHSVEAFLDDFAKLSDMLVEVTGVKPEVFRFPGGSNTGFLRRIQQEVIAELLRRGYTYFDWEVTGATTSPEATAESIRRAVVNGSRGRDRAIVLLHDAGNPGTVTALPHIIDSLKAAGYTFAVLDRTVRPVFFNYLH
jgi:peptidoglycan/xylan/chitin deacetylase (PgdA/CDA1 family)